jgi:hypothetical protein
VESSCEFGTEPSGSIKCWETIEYLTTGDISSSAQLHGVRFVCVYRLTEDGMLVMLDQNTSSFLLRYYNVRLTQHTFFIIYFYFQTAKCVGLFVMPSSGKSDTISRNQFSTKHPLSLF